MLLRIFLLMWENLLNKDRSNGIVNIGSIFTPNQLKNLSSDDTVKILSSLDNVDKNFARVIGSKVPKNTSINDASRVLSAAPVEIILQSNPSDIVKNLDKIDLGNMDDKKKTVLAQTVRF